MVDSTRYSSPSLQVQDYHKELLVDLLNRRPGHAVHDHPEWFDDANPEAFLELIDLELVKGIEYSISGKGGLTVQISDSVGLTETGYRIAKAARASIASNFRRVFVSYVHDDSREVDILCAALENSGVRTWRDVNQLLPGDDWKVAISHAIENGVGFICCFSESSEKRSKSYMFEELTLAIEQLRMRPIDSGWFMPILLSKSEVPAVPIGGGRTLRDLHFIRWYESRDHSLKFLLESIARLP